MINGWNNWNTVETHAIERSIIPVTHDVPIETPLVAQDVCKQMAVSTTTPASNRNCDVSQYFRDVLRRRELGSSNRLLTN